MTPALIPFYARWLRIEEAKLFAEIAAAGLDADAAWEAFRVERDKERPIEAKQMDGDAIGAVKGAAPTAGRHWRRTVAVQTIQESERSSKPAADLPAGSGADEIPASIPITKHIDIQPHRSTLRPLCQSPANCGGYGSVTCHTCLVAAGKTEAA
jgi:hypothetical protein